MPRRLRPASPRRLAGAALLALPGALTVYLSFNAGGYFADTQGLIALLLAVVLVLRITLADEPFAGFSGPLAVALGALALYAVWTLGSALWSDAPARAMLEFDRALLYGVALALFGSIPRRTERTAWALRGLALGIAGVCLFALLSRVLPEAWPTARDFAADRLSYPLTYWNALGLLATLGLILSLHLASSGRETPAVRVAAAVVCPMLGATLLLTFSRGAIVVAVVGLAAYVLLGRPTALLSGLLATVPATAVAIAAAYGADRLATLDPTAPPAVEQGQDLAVIVALCMIGAGLVRGLLIQVDRRLERRRAGRGTRGGRVPPAARLVGSALVIAAAVVAAVVAGLPSEIERQYDRFVASDFQERELLRERLTNPGNNGRLELWDVALETLAKHPARGAGAGTYQVVWTQERPSGQVAVDGHSLYLETLAELGVVGLVLLLVVVASLMVGFAARRRGSARSLYTALLAAGLAWGLEVGVDWGWEMPAVTLWLFALGGLALASRAESGRIRDPARFTRVAVGAGVLVLAVTPALVFASQTRLDDAVEAFDRGDCEAAIDAALDSSRTLGVRPEPFEILGYCDARVGLDSLAIQAMRNAVERDPENWEFRYGLALVTGAAGRDPRQAAEAARRLNPLEPLTSELVDRFETGGPRQWEREARSAPLPFDLGAG